MHEFYNKALVAFLGMLAASVLLVYASIGWSHIEAPLLSDNADLLWHLHQDTLAGPNGKSSVDVLESKPALRLSLVVSPIGPNAHASVDLMFDDKLGKPALKDLTRYATVSFFVKCAPANTLVLVIPTYDPAISQRDNILSYRTLASFFPCNEKPSRVDIDLTRLETPQWWFDMFHMDLSKHRYQLDQVPRLTFGTTFQSPTGVRSQVDISQLQLNGRDYRYPIGCAVILLIAWGGFSFWCFRAHTRSLIAHLDAKLRKDMPLIAYQQLSMEPHRDKEKAAVLRHIATHYTDPDIDIESVATTVGTTRSKINELLKSELGFTFSGYLNKLRLTEAARLLAEKNSATVAEIAYSVGYGNVSYFNKLFKEEYGSTPKAFRIVSRPQSGADTPPLD